MAMRAALAASSAPAKEKKVKKKQNSEQALRRLRKVLDGLLGVGVAAKKCATEATDEGVGARCKVIVRAALTARHEARRALEAVLLGDRVGLNGHERHLEALENRLKSLPDGLAPEVFDVAAARRESNAKDARCASYLGKRGSLETRGRMSALKDAMGRHRRLERSWAFQRSGTATR